MSLRRADFPRGPKENSSRCICLTRGITLPYRDFSGRHRFPTSLLASGTFNSSPADPTKPHFPHQPFKAAQGQAPGISSNAHSPSHQAPRAHASPSCTAGGPWARRGPTLSPLHPGFRPPVPSPPPGSSPPKPQQTQAPLNLNGTLEIPSRSPHLRCHSTCSFPRCLSPRVHPRCPSVRPSRALPEP